MLISVRMRMLEEYVFTMVRGPRKPCRSWSAMDPDLGYRLTHSPLAGTAAARSASSAHSSQAALKLQDSRKLERCASPISTAQPWLCTAVGGHVDIWLREKTG
ncbi:hypothetical protein CB1_002341006 [Camelus ferus]|nr:hypothetical protein CB1_002341006 [Camelus ferus]